MTILSGITCQVSQVMCRMSHVTCHMSLTPTATATDPPPADYCIRYQGGYIELNHANW